MIKSLAVFILQFINPKKPLGTKLFNAIARLAVTPTLEAAAFREQNGQVEVFLILRSMSDASYPGKWHLPGTVIRPGETLKESLNRMAKTECAVNILNYEVIGLMNNLKEPRGHFISPITLVNFTSEPKNGKWVSVTSLDETVIEFHKNLIIPLALKYYKAENKMPVQVIGNI